jgi:hypothetical protein
LKHIIFFALLLGVASCKASHAQSPTDTFIRIQNLRTASSHPDIQTHAVVIRSHLISRKGVVFAHVTVNAPTAAIAHHVAIRDAYRRALSVVALPSGQYRYLLDNLASATAELKTARSTIVSEHKTQSGCTVEVELTQSLTSLTQDVRSNGLANFRLVLLMPEFLDGVQSSDSSVQTALTGTLVNDKFQVYDWTYITSQKPLLSLANATLSGQQPAAAELGTKFFANMVVVGRVTARRSQNNDGIISYIADTQLRMIEANTGQVLFAKEYSQKGFGQDSTQAAQNALTALANAVAGDLPAELLAHYQEYPVTVEVASESPQQVSHLSRFLQNLPGVQNVQQVQSGNNILFRVTSRERPVAFGASISEGGSYQVASFSTHDEGNP